MAPLLILQDVDLPNREIGAREISVLGPLEDAPRRGREMSVLDPDGNRLRFPTTGEST